MPTPKVPATVALPNTAFPVATTVTALTSARLSMVLAAIMLPVDVISATDKSPVTPKNPAIFAPADCITTTLATPPTPIVTLALAIGILTLLPPLAIPDTPPVANSWAKLLLHFWKAVRNGSPKPSFGERPTLIIS